MIVITAMAVVAMTVQSAAQEPVPLHVAGSLRAASSEVAKSFEATTGLKVEAKYGPSGLLRDEIAGGAKAEVFASANMRGGQRIAEGAVGEVLTRENLETIYRAPVRVLVDAKDGTNAFLPG